MENEIFGFIAEIELLLVQFYQRVNNVARLSANKELFNLMIQQSLGHRNQILELSKKYTMPSLNKKHIMSLQDKIQNKLWEKIAKEENVIKTLNAMVDAENQTGMLYQSMANYYKNLSAYYLQISTEIESLSKEEFGHAEIIKNNILK